MYFSCRDTEGNPGKLCEWKSFLVFGYIYDGIMCTEIRVQIWIKPLSEICGFLAMRGEHNRILAHMPCTSARSSAGCQHQSVHHSPPTPFHNTEQKKKKKSQQYRSKARPISGEDQKADVQGEWNARIDWPHCFGSPPAQSSNRYLRDKQPSAWWCITTVAARRLMTSCCLGQVSPEQFGLKTPRAKTDRPTDRQMTHQTSIEPPPAKLNSLFKVVIFYIWPSTFDWVTSHLANQLELKLWKVRVKPNSATRINYLQRNHCYRSVCFSKDNNEINKWEKKNGSEKMKWWRGGVLWNCAVKRFSFLISWSADDGACVLTAESD